MSIEYQSYYELIDSDSEVKQLIEQEKVLFKLWLNTGWNNLVGQKILWGIKTSLA